MLLMHQIHRRAATAAAQLRLIMWTVCFVNYCTLESVDSRLCSSATQDSIKLCLAREFEADENGAAAASCCRFWSRKICFGILRANKRTRHNVSVYFSLLTAVEKENRCCWRTRRMFLIFLGYFGKNYSAQACREEDLVWMIHCEAFIGGI